MIVVKQHIPMKSCLAILILFSALLVNPAAALQSTRPADAVSSACLRWIAPIERYYGIPVGLLTAMSYVESNWRGAPWPWALNINGTPYYAASAADAARMMTDPLGRIRRDVAVGCLQIHMKFHAEAFAAPHHALEPRANVAYAGRYLRMLRDRHGSWVDAVAHFGGDTRSPEYVCRVIRYRIELGYQRLNEAAARTCQGRI